MWRKSLSWILSLHRGMSLFPFIVLFSVLLWDCLLQSNVSFCFLLIADDTVTNCSELHMHKVLLPCSKDRELPSPVTISHVGQKGNISCTPIWSSKSLMACGNLSLRISYGVLVRNVFRTDVLRACLHLQAYIGLIIVHMADWPMQTKAKYQILGLLVRMERRLVCLSLPWIESFD